MGSAHGWHSEVVSYASLAEAKLDTLIVAKVGDLEITAKEFLLSYEYGPAFVKRRKDSKRHYLEFMINEKLLALDGYSQGLAVSPEVTETLAEIEKDLATEELYKDEILSQISVTEEEVETGINMEQRHISLKWLYAPTFSEISKLQKLLRAGAPFDSLFALLLSDSVALEDRFLETTRFRLQTQNPALAAIVDTLTYGNSSAPIATGDGFYIVKVVDLWINAITTESEQMKLQHDVSRAIFKRKADVLSDEYVHQMMLEHNPIIRRRTFDLLKAFLGKSIFPREKFSDWKLTRHLMAEYGPIDRVIIEDHLDKTLVKLVNEDISLREFLVWYRMRESNIRFSAASPQAFFVSLEQLIWKMVRDKLLSERAYQRGLQHRERVRTQRQWWATKIVYTARKTQLAGAIRLSENSIEDYFNENARSYRNRKGYLRPFKMVENAVRQDAYRYEWTKTLWHHILSLKQKHKVEVYKERLESLHVDIEHQPNAIDMYTVKKGGTFPRPAYPTIDYDWKAWY